MRLLSPLCYVRCPPILASVLPAPQMQGPDTPGSNSPRSSNGMSAEGRSSSSTGTTGTTGSTGSTRPDRRSTSFSFPVKPQQNGRPGYPAPIVAANTPTSGLSLQRSGATVGAGAGRGIGKRCGLRFIFFFGCPPGGLHSSSFRSPLGGLHPTLCSVAFQVHLYKTVSTSETAAEVHFWSHCAFRWRRWRWPRGRDSGGSRTARPLSCRGASGWSMDRGLRGIGTIVWCLFLDGAATTEGGGWGASCTGEASPQWESHTATHNSPFTHNKLPQVATQDEEQGAIARAGQGQGPG